MTGRLGIDDVTPTVGRRAPSQQGRRRRGRADRCHRLARGSRRDRRERRVEEGRQRRAGPARPDGPDARRRRPLHRDGRAGRAGPVDVPGRRLERPVGHLATRRHRQARTPGRARTSWRTTSRSARGCCSAWAAAPPNGRTATCSSPRRTRCATPRCRCRTASRPRCSPPSTRSWSSGPVRELITRGQPRQVYVDRSRALFGSWYEFFPRSTGGRDENGKPVHGTFTTSAKELDRVAAMGFDVVYLPPIHPDRHGAPQGPEQRRAARRQPRRATRRRRLAVGHRVGRGRPRRDRPRAGRLRRLRRLRRPRPRPRHGGRARLRAAGRAGPPVGRRPPRVVHGAPRRLDRLRGEPAEEVPGHLPGQLRQRPRGHLRRVAARA